jgi:ATP-dependent RNA helicase DDX3X
MVTTGVAARGLDFSNVMHVINYDLPSVEHGGITEYLHRIGRTARMGNIGMSTSLYNDRDEALAPMLVKVLMENEQHIPEFLEPYKPEEGAKLDFEDTSDDEDADGGGADAWGGGSNEGTGDGAWGGAGGDAGGDGAWGAGDGDGGNQDDAWGPAGGGASREAPPDSAW